MSIGTWHLAPVTLQGTEIELSFPEMTCLGSPFGRLSALSAQPSMRKWFPSVQEESYKNSEKKEKVGITQMSWDRQRMDIKGDRISMALSQISMKQFVSFSV